jgi:alpha,alpha-trehalase
MSRWTLVWEGFDAGREPLREALCTLGNGHFATRGAVAEAVADGTHYPGTYLAGGYNRLTSTIDGRRVENEDLVNMPNWLPLSFKLGAGPWFDVHAMELLEHRHVLDLRRGVLIRQVRFRDPSNRVTRIRFRRFVHMGDAHLAGQELRITPENWSGQVTVRSGLDGRVVNAGVARYRALANRHLVPLRVEQVGPDTVLLQVETTQSHLRVAQAARTRVFKGHNAHGRVERVLLEEGYAAQELTFEVSCGEPIRVEKLMSLYSSRDPAISHPAMQAVEKLQGTASFERELGRHALAWEHLWRRCDLDIDHPEEEHTSQVLRLHVFHLLQTTSPHTTELDTGIPARGWHGEAYRGHIFWDELFVFPLLNLRMPVLTRALLRYRHRRLPRARQLAREAGLAGAMFPWQSGSDGREESQQVHLNPRSGRWVPDVTHLQRHINSAIAFNVWQYYEVTGDSEFLADYGAELLLEIARFWASLSTLNADTGRYDIRGVVGPDEFHTAYPDAERPGIDNNAYTNVMAAWSLIRAKEALMHLAPDRREELCETLELGTAELSHWDEVSRLLAVPFHDGRILQFEGYQDLRELDWARYRRKYGDVHRIDRILEAEGDTTNAYKVSKQADALMLFYLFSTQELTELFARLGYALTPQMVHRTIEYYMRRTTHGSTLSRVVHAWVLARSDRKRSWRLFRLALDSDISDVQGGTTPEGIHVGAMAGSVDLMQRCYTGIEARADVLHLDPRLPRELRGLRLSLRYRRQVLDLELTCDQLRLTHRYPAAEAVRVCYRGQFETLHGGQTLTWPLNDKGRSPEVHHVH